MIQGEINKERKWKGLAGFVYSVGMGGDMATSADHVTNLDFVGRD